MIILSSHVWSITPVEFWWDAISSLALFSSIFSSLLLVLHSVSVSFWKVTSSCFERFLWTLIQGRFEFSITLSLLYVFRLFYSLLLTREVTVIHLPSLEMYKILLPCLLLDDVNIITFYFAFVIDCNSTIVMKPEDWEDVHCHEYWVSI